MKTASIYDIKGKNLGKFSLDEDYFNGQVNKALLHQAVLMYLANLRHGCVSTKKRSQVSGGGRKPWRQKGTGRARVGSIRSPLWRGGGVVFGPHPRSYRYDLSGTVKSLALRHSLNSKIKTDELVVVDKLAFSSSKTKEVTTFLKAINAQTKPLIVLERHNAELFRACRNIPGVTVKAFNNINAHEVLKHNKVIFSKQAIENLVKLRGL